MGRHGPGREAGVLLPRHNDSGLRIVILFAYEKMSVFSLYDWCNETSCLPEPVSVVLDILCLDGVCHTTRECPILQSLMDKEMLAN